MATPSPSSSTLSQGSTARPQADPLPTKRGEIGYRESLNLPVSSSAPPESDVTTPHTPLPERHPADREPRQAASEPVPPSIASENDSQPSPEPRSSSSPLFSFFKPKFNKRGVRTSTILLLVTQCSFLLVTIGLWIIFARLILPSSYIGRHMATSVFIHVSFTVGTIFQVVLLERLVFRYRAERYAMLHPGEVIPDPFNRGGQTSTRLALAPWNRPPLPTYAAVLMESGVGTGDVEDNHIAVAPPPAYGHTRGSTLLLAGFIDAELREQSRRAREARGERVSQATIASVESNKTSSVKSRPTSYVTVDSEWDARCDMSRATYLAETLARLEAEETDLTTVVVSPAPTQTGFVNTGSPSRSPPS